MSVSLATGSVVATADETIAISAMFSVTASASSPTYLILSGLDRDEYTVGYATSDMGTVSGDGSTAQFTNAEGGDAYSVGIVFTLEQDGSGFYYSNATYGNFDDLTFTASSFTTGNASLSLFTTDNSYAASDYADDPYTLLQNPRFVTDLGSVSVVTEPSAAPAPVQATPDSIAAIAQSFVGDAWNDNGCWTLACNIAAEAGASLPVVTALAGPPGVANGEWIVAYNGPALTQQDSDWQSLLTPGEMVVFENTEGEGHITTVVSGSGGAAMLVDNIEYVNSGGTIVNSAHDGSANDVIVASPHPASQEFAGVDPGTVVIYQLDTPVVAAVASGETIGEGANQSLGSLFTATDPLAGQSVTEWQVYDTAASDTLAIGGNLDPTAHSAAAAATVTSLAGSALLTGTVAGSDTVEVRAFNGLYWGDWQGLTFDVAAAGASCFLTGTRIATPGGDVPVETLHPGAVVRLAAGGGAPVRWVGWHTLSRRFGDPLLLWPIRIRAGALAAGLPHRDLLLSPGHAVWLDGVLVHAGALVNGTSILREPPPAERYVYWHVELDSHALILAEGTPVETFLDAWQELPFDNRAGRPAPPAHTGELPYPRCKSARQLPGPLRARLAAWCGPRRGASALEQAARIGAIAPARATGGVIAACQWATAPAVTH